MIKNHGDGESSGNVGLTNDVRDAYCAIYPGSAAISAIYQG
jgi:hypothetical protein